MAVLFLTLCLCAPQQDLLCTAGIMLTARAETFSAVQTVTPAESLSAVQTVTPEVSPAELQTGPQGEILTAVQTETGKGSGARAEEGISGSGQEAGAAAEVVWPVPDRELKAAAAVVMDADTGEVLWGKDIHSKRYPASITKLLTALVVLDHCSLDEKVTFSSAALSNLESGAVTAGTVPGDELSVRDCLYALLLKSANEVANALAEHVAGSISDFAVLMNRKAEELGCQDSDFRNPSGLTNSEHVTSAYDMGLIAIACANNEDFLALESENTRRLGPTKNYPDGLKVTVGHKMLKQGEEFYDSRVIAGKTGFTSAAGNTLVTVAEDRGRRVVAVVLKDTNPEHYRDTEVLLNFGLESFDLLKPTLEVLMETHDLEKKLLSSGAIRKTDVTAGEKNELSLSALPEIAVPRGAGLESVEVRLDRVLPKDAPENAVARLRLSCLGHEGREVYVINRYTPPAAESEPADGKKEKTGKKDGGGESPDGGETTGGADSGSGIHDRPPVRIGLLGWFLIILLLTVAGFAGYLYIRNRAERKRAEERRRKRRERRERLESGETQEHGRRTSRPARRTADSRTAEEEILLKSLSGQDVNGTETDPGAGSGTGNENRTDSGTENGRIPGAGSGTGAGAGTGNTEAMGQADCGPADPRIPGDPADP